MAGIVFVLTVVYLILSGLLYHGGKDTVRLGFKRCAEQELTYEQCFKVNGWKYE